MNIISTFLDRVKTFELIIAAIRDAGGVVYLVGGCVRDLVLGCEVKDFDIEVHKLSLEQLESCLKKFGPVSLIGKQFGVLRLHTVDVDWSLPRHDSVGRKPKVDVDPTMTIQEACRRRDVTMNAMVIDLGFICDEIEKLYDLAQKNVHFDCAKEFQIIDAYHGLDDIKNKVLRAVDPNLFTQDPLRFYRVMQFISRFEMGPDAQLAVICKTMDLRDTRHGGQLARERIYEELKKLLLKSRQPSLGFRWIKAIGRLDELFPELGALVGVVQRVDYHPEGDVFEHSMQAVDAAAQLHIFATVVPQNDEEKLMILWGALCHDLGKPMTSDNVGSSKGHDIAGVAITKKFLKHFTRETWLIDAVCKLVLYHRAPLSFTGEGAIPSAYKRLALKLVPQVNLTQLCMIGWCDLHGRNATEQKPILTPLKGDAVLKKFLSTAQEINVHFGPEAPILQGRDLLGLVPQGPEMGQMLKRAYHIQIEEDIKDKEVLKARASKIA